MPKFNEFAGDPTSGVTVRPTFQGLFVLFRNKTSIGVVKGDKTQGYEASNHQGDMLNSGPLKPLPGQTPANDE